MKYLVFLILASALVTSGCQTTARQGNVQSSPFVGSEPPRSPAQTADFTITKFEGKGVNAMIGNCSLNALDGAVPGALTSFKNGDHTLIVVTVVLSDGEQNYLFTLSGKSREGETWIDLFGANAERGRISNDLSKIEISSLWRSSSGSCIFTIDLSR